MQLIAPPSDTRIALEWRYQAKPLLTPTEAAFHTCLASLSDGRCHIVCKPRLADVFESLSGLTGFNKISQKHVDFLVCRPDDWMPMLAIELDDHTHNQARVKQRDMLVNAIFAQVGIPLLRIHVTEVERIETLVEKLSLAWQQRWQRLQPIASTAA